MAPDDKTGREGIKSALGCKRSVWETRESKKLRSYVAFIEEAQPLLAEDPLSARMWTGRPAPEPAAVTGH